MKKYQQVCDEMLQGRLWLLNLNLEDYKTRDELISVQNEISNVRDIAAECKQLRINFKMSLPCAIWDKEHDEQIDLAREVEFLASKYIDRIVERIDQGLIRPVKTVLYTYPEAKEEDVLDLLEIFPRYHLPQPSNERLYAVVNNLAHEFFQVAASELDTAQLDIIDGFLSSRYRDELSREFFNRYLIPPMLLASKYPARSSDFTRRRSSRLRNTPEHVPFPAFRPHPSHRRHRS